AVSHDRKDIRVGLTCRRVSRGRQLATRYRALPENPADVGRLAVARYSIDPSRSVMTMDARSSVHPIRGVARGLEGFIEAEVSDGQLDPSAPATMRFELSVDQLKSGNSLYD